MIHPVLCVRPEYDGEVRTIRGQRTYRNTCSLSSLHSQLQLCLFYQTLESGDRDGSETRVRDINPCRWRWR